jgi:hypothetical protein
MTEDSGAFKTNPGDCIGFGHFVNARELSEADPAAPGKIIPEPSWQA